MKEELQKLIIEINNKGKASPDDGTPSKVYSDVPLLYRASDMKNFMPQKYREMQKIAYEHRSVNTSKAEIFYLQASFMADFEDDHPERAPLIGIFPTFTAMNDKQLRTYFSWRTKLRHGIFESVSVAYMFVYIFELINCIGVTSPEDAFAELYEFYEKYTPYVPKLADHIPGWLFDFVIYYGLDISFLDFLGFKTGKSSATVLTDIPSYTPGEVFEAVNLSLSDKIKQSGFYAKNQEAFELAVYKVLDEISKEDTDWLVGKYSVDNYVIFRDAVFYDRQCYKDYVYNISDNKRIRCKNYSWQIERFVRYSGRNRELNEVVKTVESEMRELWGYPYKLKPGNISPSRAAIVKEKVREVFDENKKVKKVEIELDPGLFDSIRAGADKTRDMLTVYGENDCESYDDDITVNEPETVVDAILPAPEDKPDAVSPEIIAAGTTETECGKELLSPEQKEFIALILNGGDHALFLREKGIRLSIMTDGINEALFDEFADNVFDFDGDMPIVISDYEDDLKGLIGL